MIIYHMQILVQLPITGSKEEWKEDVTRKQSDAA